MMTTVELSMYPFREQYRDAIRDFVRALREQDGIRATTGPTSTVLVGEHSRVMSVLDELFRWSQTEHGRSVFVAKFILDYDPS